MPDPKKKVARLKKKVEKVRAKTEKKTQKQIGRTARKLKRTANRTTGTFVNLSPQKARKTVRQGNERIAKISKRGERREKRLLDRIAKIKAQMQD